jgi:carboxypeptidase Q
VGFARAPRSLTGRRLGAKCASKALPACSPAAAGMRISSPAFSPPPPFPLSPKPLPPDPDALVAALRTDALGDEHAWRITEDLTTEVGQRLAGTEAEARARAWAVRRLTALGFANVRVDEFAMPVWERGREAAELLGPTRRSSSSPRSATAPRPRRRRHRRGDRLRRRRRASRRAGRAGARQDRLHRPRHAPHPGRQRLWHLRRAPAAGSDHRFAEGRAAIVIRSIGTDREHRNPHTGVMNFTEGATPIPAGALSNPDADQLERIFARGQRPTLRLTLESR